MDFFFVLYEKVNENMKKNLENIIRYKHIKVLYINKVDG